MTIETISISAIYDEIETQSRATINQEVVADYAERMEAGDKFPPVALFQEGEIFYIGDGFHRLAACVKNGYKDILAEVKPGGKLDALKCSIGANRVNGLHRSNADKRRCAWLALENFGDMTDRAIAELVGVSHCFVAGIRSERAAEKDILTTTSGNRCHLADEPATRKGRNGKTYPACKNPRSAAVKGESQILAALKTLWSQAAAGEKESFAGWVRQTMEVQ